MDWAGKPSEDIEYELGLIDSRERERKALDRIFREQLARLRLRPARRHPSMYVLE